MSHILFLARDEPLPAIGCGEIALLTRIALVCMVWQREIERAVERKQP